MNFSTETLAPIILFVFDRPVHAEKTLESLMKNKLADESTLYIYSDGPKKRSGDEQLARIKETRRVIRKKKWCKRVEIIELETNKGVDELTIMGITKIINEFGKIIVLEDDLVTSKGFLSYMNESLDLYKNEEKVMSIAGYSFPVKKEQKSPYFIFGGTSAWGWATWKRAWDKFDPDYKSLASKLNGKPALTRKFDFNNSFYYFEMLQSCTEKEKPWDIRWYASVFLSGGFGLWPNASLVQNIGQDSSGVHREETMKFQHPSLAEKIIQKKIPVKENLKARKEMTRFFKDLNHLSIFSKIRNKFRF